MQTDINQTSSNFSCIGHLRFNTRFQTENIAMLKCFEVQMYLKGSSINVSQLAPVRKVTSEKLFNWPTSNSTI